MIYLRYIMLTFFASMITLCLIGIAYVIRAFREDLAAGRIFPDLCNEQHNNKQQGQTSPERTLTPWQLTQILM